MKSTTSRLTVLAAATALAATVGAGAPAASAASAAPRDDAVMPAAPYLYLGWGNPPDPTSVMSATGIKDFTLAFILAGGGGCNPEWDGNRPLTGGSDESTINKIRSAGGDVMPSIGGYNGSKLGEACATADDLAGAYAKVVDAYKLKAIDIDIEASEFDNAASRNKVVAAIKALKQSHPDVKVIVTMPTNTDGPSDSGKAMIQQAADTKSPVDVWTIMPFDFSGNGADMGQLAIQASEGLHATLKNAFGTSDDATYRMQGISSMNGHTDQASEAPVTLDDFTTMRNYASQHHLARFTFWAVNRDRACPSGQNSSSTCSGIDQQDWDFTKSVAQFEG